MAYTTPDAVNAVLARRGEELRWDEADIEDAIDLAEHLINAFCGRHFYAEPVSEVHIPIDDIVVVDTPPIMDIVAVEDTETGEDVEYEIISSLWGYMRVYTTKPVKITYTYNDPDDPVPDDVKRVASEVAANILSLAYEAYGSVRLGDLSISGPEGGRYLTSALRAVLQPYKYTGRPR